MGHDGPVVARILTWNLQGRERPDLERVVAELAGSRPDLVALQEVPRRQARWLAARLGWSLVWRFKHWSVVVPPEGLALLSPRPLTDVASVHLAHPLRVWSWRRRIAVRATVEVPDGPLTVVATHLGAGVGDPERVRQAELVVDLLRAGTVPVRQACVVGDLNTRPRSPVLAAFAAHGLRDAWAEVRPGEPGRTNWSTASRAGPPDQRLDYALVGAGLEVVDVEAPAFGTVGFERYGELSDHLPVSVTVARRSMT